MNPAEASMLTAKLLAAYPAPRDNLTAAVYVEKLLPLDHGICREAIDDLICGEERLPSVALVLKVHRGILKRQREARPALEEPDVSPEQMAENVRQGRALAEKLAARVGVAGGVSQPAERVS